jgi:nanoRNase/pAp phosphatase (c-di-AMP/oligoRNAs hydrolase)
LYLGADVAFVGAEKEGEVRISSRANREMVKAGIHLGKSILPGVMPLIKGDAGGHAGAAGANGTDASKLDEALDVCVQRTRLFLKGL